MPWIGEDVAPATTRPTTHWSESSRTWPPSHRPWRTHPAHRSLIDRLETLLADDARDELLGLFMREAVDLSGDQLQMLRSAPAWANRIAAAHTIPREMRAEHTAVFDPEHAVNITAPTLLLVGEQSPGHVKAESAVIAAILPNAQVSAMEGQQHTAHHVVPDLVSDLTMGFLRNLADH